MKSVLDRLRDEDREAVLALTPAERVALALALGERDLEMFRESAGSPVSKRRTSSTDRSSMVAGCRPVWPADRVTLLASVAATLRAHGTPFALTGAGRRIRE